MCILYGTNCSVMLLLLLDLYLGVFQPQNSSYQWENNNLLRILNSLFISEPHDSYQKTMSCLHNGNFADRRESTRIC